MGGEGWKDNQPTELAAGLVPLTTWFLCLLLGRAPPESTSLDVSQSHTDSRTAP